MGKSISAANKILTTRQAKLLFKEVGREKSHSQSNPRPSNKRYITDYYLFSIAYYSGLRVSELTNLKWANIHDDNIEVINGKGGKNRTVFFGRKLQEIITEYKKITKEVLKGKCGPDRSLFIGQRGPLNREACHRRFKYWVKRIPGLPDHLSFHSCRHGYGTRLLDEGVNIATVKEQLGHANIAITSTYLHFTQEAKEKLLSVT